MKTSVMPFFSDISLRRGVLLFVVILGLLIGGCWATIDVIAENLLNRDASDSASDWAKFVATNVTDLAQIAAGEQPSARSLDFFEAARAAGQVFRYVIYNPEGYSQLVADKHGVSFVDISAFSVKAKQAVASDAPVVDAKSGGVGDVPAYFAEAFVPVRVNGHPVAVVAASVDETARRANFYNHIVLTSVVVCSLMGLAFGVPAIAWYRRTLEKQRADRRIQFLAHHDVLTGLANRARLGEWLQAALAVLPPSGALIAVHYIDIDYFKQVNDNLGHDGGDFLLSTIGARLRDMMRIDDMVARLGGDEFVVVQTGLAAKQQAWEFAKRLAAVIGAPMNFNGQEIQVGATIGVAFAPADGATPERVLKSADLALYDGKAAGRDCIRMFAPEMDAAMQQRIKLERIVREAVEHDRFQVHYQPVFEMHGNRLVGFEALARLPGPDGAFIPPAVFIPLAEELRLIDKIGEWVLREACRTACSWPPALTVAVNLSPAQFESGSVEKAVAAALQESGLKPHRLELEITESLLLHNNEPNLAALKRLRELGVSIVMDDFGTGYSSLSYLWKFPFDKIKIDRSFMDSFEKSEHHVETVVKSIIALSREMHMRVTVEGVETAKQVEFLYDADADQVQGFYFGRPVPSSEAAVEILTELHKTAGAEQAAPAAQPLKTSTG
jgi:diguanylate cyclase (GGDEF)-like protein